MAVHDTTAMIAGMSPQVRPGVWHFVTIPPRHPDINTLRATAYASMLEPEGLSLILDADTCAQYDLPRDLPMAHILLNVVSALDGVGLTAAVAETLADANMPCNVVAGNLHDHIFVPYARADEAVALLTDRAAQSQ